MVLEVLSLRTAFLNYSLARTECREKPPPWGWVVGILAVVAFAVTVWRSEPDGAVEAGLGLLAGILVGAPVVVLAMLSAVWYRCSRNGVVNE